MVKGRTRRVIVVDSPDPKLFEQAIFIVRNDVLGREGVTPQSLLGEACRIARGEAEGRRSRRMPPWLWYVLSALAAAGVWAVLKGTGIL